MDIGITLIGQMVTFGLLVFFTMKFVWPPLTKALEARRAKIAEGLSAADQGKEMLKVAESDALVLIVSAREEAARIVGLARVQGEEMVAQAREEARQEGVRQLEAARMRIDSEERSAREELRKQSARLALDIASKVLGAEIDPKRHQALVDRMSAQLN